LQKFFLTREDLQ